MRQSTLAILANIAVVAIALGVVAASRSLPKGDGPDSMNVAAFVGSSAAVVAAVTAIVVASTAHRRAMAWRAAAALPLLGAGVLSFEVLLTWHVEMPCGVVVGGLSPLLCLHPYWLLLPAFGAAMMGTAVCAAPSRLRPHALTILATGSTGLLVGVTQLLLRNEHGSLELGVVAATVGLVLCAFTIWNPAAGHQKS